MKTIATAVIASLFAVAPAHAAPKPVPTTEPATAANDQSVPVRNASTRYCYKTEQTGSRLTSRVCKTRDEWKQVGVIVPEKL
ncbi:MAG: hypothetical protein PGN12_06720 [Sphingomonas phyllosphaerae]